MKQIIKQIYIKTIAATSRINVLTEQNNANIFIKLLITIECRDLKYNIKKLQKKYINILVKRELFPNLIFNR